MYLEPFRVRDVGPKVGITFLLRALQQEVARIMISYTSRVSSPKTHAQLVEHRGHVNGAVAMQRPHLPHCHRPRKLMLAVPQQFEQGCRQHNRAADDMNPASP